MKERKTRITVGTILFKGHHILFGKSRNKEGERRYILPVGHLEYMEGFHECARREIKEECGIEIENIKLQFISNTDDYKPKHYVHIGLIADWKSGEPEVLEEGWIEEWVWIHKDEIPEELSKGAKLTIQAWKENKNIYDI